MAKVPNGNKGIRVKKSKTPNSCTDSAPYNHNRSKHPGNQNWENRNGKNWNWDNWNKENHCALKTCLRVCASLDVSCPRHVYCRMPGKWGLL